MIRQGQHYSYSTTIRNKKYIAKIGLLSQDIRTPSQHCRVGVSVCRKERRERWHLHPSLSLSSYSNSPPIQLLVSSLPTRVLSRQIWVVTKKRSQSSRINYRSTQHASAGGFLGCMSDVEAKRSLIISRSTIARVTVALRWSCLSRLLSEGCQGKITVRQGSFVKTLYEKAP